MIETLVWRDCPVVIPYYGGKFELSKKLIPMLAPHNRYLEVFAGGLSMFFRKRKSKASVVNDIDNDIVNLYMVVLDHFDEFCEFIFWIPKSRKTFVEAREHIMASKEVNIPDVRRACLYYYIIRNAFNKNPYNSISSAPKKDWRHSLKDELIQSREHLEGALIENLDFRKFIDKYKAQEGDMWYFDPPYVIAGEKGTYYYHDFNMEMHEALIKKCDDINNLGAKFMVSYDDKKIIRDLYNDYNVRTVETVYAGSAIKKVVRELVIMNYEPMSQTEIFDTGVENDRQCNGGSSS